jgi:FHA domain
VIESKRSSAKPRSGGELQRVLAAERRGEPFLHWRGVDDELAITALPSDVFRIDIGRGDRVDIALERDAQVSRQHAFLEFVAGGWTLVDDGLSTNGTYVNGARLRSRHRLADGDRICLGKSDLIYRASAGAGAGAEATVSVAEVEAARNLTEMQRKVLIALCRPMYANESSTPTTNRKIAEELNLTVDSVKSYLRVLFERFGLSDLPQNEKRARLVATALVSGVLAPHDF